MPAATPYITPVAEPIVPTAVLALLHTPPVALSVKVVVAPWHTEGEPNIDPPVAAESMVTTAPP